MEGKPVIADPYFDILLSDVKNIRREGEEGVVTLGQIAAHTMNLLSLNQLQSPPLIPLQSQHLSPLWSLHLNQRLSPQTNKLQCLHSLLPQCLLLSRDHL